MLRFCWLGSHLLALLYLLEVIRHLLRLREGKHSWRAGWEWLEKGAPINMQKKKKKKGKGNIKAVGGGSVVGFSAYLYRFVILFFCSSRYITEQERT
mmetsp:Transcript_34913/g.64648  ORF Transcript_34913/g.64648 Transcript_34913/m.64648 type:complete len:97 (-) Transcript_34913:641-931(-)